MRSATPKHLHPLLGRRHADWVIEAVRALGPEPLVVVTSPDAREAFEGETVAVQETPRGTGDATAAARDGLEGFDGDVLVVTGDAATITSELLAALLETHRSAGAAATVLSFEPADPGAYGRIVRNGDGALQAIVEARDASAEELAIREVNSSIYVFEAADSGRPSNADPAERPGRALPDRHRARPRCRGERVAVHMAADPTEAEGVNTRAELAAAAAVLRDRINLGHMLAGAMIVDPATTWIDPTVELEPDCTIQPFTVLRGGTRVAGGADVGPHVVAVDAEIGPDTLVGPFCYLRPGTVLESGAKAGAFVEIKNSRIGNERRCLTSPTSETRRSARTRTSRRATSGQLPSSARQAKRPDDDRPQRPDRCPQCVRRASGDRRRRMDRRGSVITEDVPPESLAVGRARQENKEG